MLLQFNNFLKHSASLAFNVFTFSNSFNYPFKQHFFCQRTFSQVVSFVP
jgi:hypothetical protein